MLPCVVSFYLHFITEEVGKHVFQTFTMYLLTQPDIGYILENVFYVLDKWVYSRVVGASSCR